MRRTSAVFRPVDAGYDRIVLIFLFGSMMKTERIVKAMPLLSTLVASWWSSLDLVVSRQSSFVLFLYIHVICERHLSLLVADDWEPEIGTRDLIDVLDPVPMLLDGVCAQTNQLDTPLGELWLEFCECAQLCGADRCEVFGVRE